MKRKRLTIPAIILGVLALLIILIWPAAPLWVRLGLEPFCIQGNWPNIKFVPCGEAVIVQQAITPRPLPTPAGDTPIPLIFDDDGSPDGMIALLYFLRNPLFDVKAVAVSCGEAHPELFAPHVQHLLAGLGRTDIPVGVGRATPLEGSNAFPEPWRQASDDFWGLSYPEAPIALAPLPAAELIVDTISNSDQPVMVFLSGTYTNLAEALRLDPDIVENISEVQVMGGAIYVAGNINSDYSGIDNMVAEWNIWVDPVAAGEIFTAGPLVGLSPLDATNQVLWTKTDAQSWISSGSAEGIMAGNLLKWMLDSWSAQGVYVWDLVAAVNATDPSLCPEVLLAVDILVAPGTNQGQTVITDQQPNASVCLDPDPDRIKSLVLSIFLQP